MYINTRIKGKLFHCLSVFQQMSIWGIPDYWPCQVEGPCVTTNWVQSEGRLSLDEMKIQENLFSTQHSVDLSVCCGSWSLTVHRRWKCGIPRRHQNICWNDRCNGVPPHRSYQSQHDGVWSQFVTTLRGEHCTNNHLWRMEPFLQFTRGRCKSKRLRFRKTGCYHEKWFLDNLKYKERLRE